VGPGYRLSPGAPVNNCRWASTSLVKLQASSGGLTPEAASFKLQAVRLCGAYSKENSNYTWPQASSNKQQATSGKL